MFSAGAADELNILSVKYGSSISNNSSDSSGGGVATSGMSALLLIDANVSSNTAALNGGGVHIGDYGLLYASNLRRGDVADPLSFVGSSISGNSAGLRGGGVFIANQTVAGDETGLDSLLASVTIDGNLSGYRGGGVYLGGNAGLLSKYSTFSANRSGTLEEGNFFSEGGGLSAAPDSQAIILSSTFSNNRMSPGYGGGALYGYYADLTVVNSTFSGNSGESVYSFNGSLSVSNTIVANTVDSGSGTDDCLGVGGFNIDEFSIIEDGSCDATRSGDPDLGPLASNGGPTRTHLPSENSIAINTGDDSECLPRDQRGEFRPASDADQCDVGAVEFTSNDATGFIVIPLPNGKAVVIPN